MLMSAPVGYALPAVGSNPVPVEFGLGAGAEGLQCALGTNRVRSYENPVLPRGQTAENPGLRGLAPAEAQIRFHARERIGRQAGPLFEYDPYFVAPIDIIQCGRHQTESERLPWSERLTQRSADLFDGGRLSIEAA